MAHIVLWLILWLTVITWIVVVLNQVMQNWLYDLIVSWLNILVDLLWTWYTYLFLSMFSLAWITLVVRFIMSWIWENPWSSANK